MEASLIGKLVYCAHPLGRGDQREPNRQNAALWVAYLAYKFRILPSCTWIVLSSVWPETDALRNLGLWLDCGAVELCDELWMVGGRVSDGMAIEARHALSKGIPVRDLTWLGRDVPMVGSDVDTSWRMTASVTEIVQL